jgi:Fic family protein
MADTPDAPAAGPKIAEKQAKEVEKLIKEKELKFEKIEIKEHKDFKIEKIEKNETKEHKDTKNEKLEKNELKEHKDAKHEKLEKVEHKEFKNEAKELKVENLEKQAGAEKGGKEIAEVGNGNPGNPVEQRVSALEQSVANMQHFITTGQRPDLSRGALSGEPAAGAPKTRGS